MGNTRVTELLTPVFKIPEIVIISRLLGDARFYRGMTQNPWDTPFLVHISSAYALKIMRTRFSIVDNIRSTWAIIVFQNNKLNDCGDLVK